MFMSCHSHQVSYVRQLTYVASLKYKSILIPPLLRESPVYECCSAHSNYENILAIYKCIFLRYMVGLLAAGGTATRAW